MAPHLGLRRVELSLTISVAPTIWCSSKDRAGQNLVVCLKFRQRRAGCLSRHGAGQQKGDFLGAEVSAQEPVEVGGLDQK